MAIAPMPLLPFEISGSWQDWLGISGYLALLGIVGWRVLATKRQE